jgi:FtsP/CotA-like multicopper oxidase with cupredoxin domain
MPVRHIYLKIESIPDYSPVCPDPTFAPPVHYGRDCMRNMGHEDGTIPTAEINARTVSVLVYREYLDPAYLVPKPDKIVLADINEPPYHRRVPGTVIYARPGDRLKIHVVNADSGPHSFHLHGLEYGIDSDGAWPFGTHASDGRRSDEICPGEHWTYTFDVTDKMIGAWPFHDHFQNVGTNVNRGLFGGVIVLPREDCDAPPRMKLPREVEELLRDLRKHLPAEPEDQAAAAAAKPAPMAMDMSMGMPMPMPAGGEGGGHAPLPMRPVEFEGRQIDWEEYLHLPGVYPCPDPNKPLHVPIFLHAMQGASGVPAFDSGPIALGGSFEATFGTEGTFAYHCNIHPQMQAKVTVAMGEAMLAVVTIDDTNPLDMKFVPAEAKVGPGGKVHWNNGNNNVHTVTENGGGLPSFCLNGRSFVGNTPTILAEAGQKIRWYVFNLDLGMMWHNFHTHGQRWHFAGEAYDGRSLGPAESFLVETTAPPVLLLPPDIAKSQNPEHRPKHAKKYHVRGDFLFHCHVEMHMMAGLAGLVRSRQTLWLTPEQAKRLSHETGLPLDHGDNDCPVIDPKHCESLDCGKWEEVAGSPSVTFMHACLLPKTDKVLYWGYGDTRDDISRIWDYSTPGGAFSLPANQPFDVTSPVHDRGLANLWSAEHAFLDTPEGTLLIHGGFTPRESYLFDPPTTSWSRVAPTAEQRFYSTSLTLANGKVLTILGGTPTSIVARSIEVYEPGTATWDPPIALPATFDYLYYPWAYVMPNGELFIAGPRGITRRFDPLAPVDDPAKTWSTLAGNRSTSGEKGTSVLLPLLPPDYKPRVVIAGGDPASAQQTSEMIDLSEAAPAWKALPNLNQPRMHQVNSVLMPDSRVFLAGGIPNVGGPAEILDSKNLAAGWVACAPMKYSRGYHSTAILLADGSILMGGDQDITGGWKSGENTPHERYFPWYYFRSRPVITGSPASVNHGATFTVNTPSATSIAEVVLIRPGAVTHGFNQSQRLVGCEITGRGATSLQVKAPPDGNIAAPGYYLLFLVDTARVPSVAAWIRVTP